MVIERIERIDLLCDSSDSESEENMTYIGIQRADRMPKKTVYVIYLKEAVTQGTECELEIKFSGKIWESTEGLFRGSYFDNKGEKKQYLATYTRPHNARRLFPCFDEPGYKVRDL